MKLLLASAVIAAFVMVPGRATPAGPGTTPPLSPEPFSSIEKKALEAIGQNRAGSAIKMLEAYGPSALRLTPDDFAMYNYVYAEALRKGKKFYDALERYRLAYLFMPAGSQKELALLKRADVYAEAGLYEEAASAYRIFLDTYGKSEYASQARLGLASALMKTARYAEALQNYEKAGNSEAALSGKAEALVATGKPEMAYAFFTSLAAQDPGYMAHSGLARYSMGEACRLLGKTEEARAYLMPLTKGEFARKAAYSLGLMAEGEGETALAAGLFRDASGSNETGIRLQALINLARCDLKLAKPDEALAALRGVGYSRSFEDLYYSGKFLLAEVLSMKGQYMRSAALLKGLLVKKAYAEAAMEALQNVMQTALDHAGPRENEKFLEIWKFAGGCLMERKRAPFVFKAAARLEAVDIGEFVNINRWIVRNGDRGLGRQAAINLVAYYVRVKDGHEAAVYFRQAALPLKDESTLRLRAGIRYLNGDYKGAERDILSIKDLNEADMELLAEAMPRAGDFGAIELVEKRLQKSKMLSPAPAALYLSLADAMYEKGFRAKALGYYRQAVGASASDKNKKALPAQDLKWALFRAQSLEEDPKGALDSLEGQGGVMGRYAVARLDEDALTDHYGLTDTEPAKK
ncbi:MAG: hypothetical protein M0Z48_12255 [Nitrospiraceae bacterium]|nr:hypothetical protein [Nitrospiraceae bacterium]